MNFQDFERETRKDPELSALIRAVAYEIEHPMSPDEERYEDEERYVVGIDDALIGLIAYVLFRWAKESLDHKRSERETDLAERRVRIIKELIDLKFTPEEATKVTEQFFKQIAQRSESDPALQKAVALMEKGTI